MFILALLNLDNKVNTIHLAFAKKLGLSIGPIDGGSQKIDDIILDSYGMVVTAFLMTDKVN